MNNERDLFYANIVSKRLKSKDASILICGGGDLDRYIFMTLGFKNVTISNLDTRVSGDKFAPYKWSFEDAQSLSFDDNAFDYVVIHAAIHHTSMPHKAILEMYRVSKKGILVFESRDSILMRILNKLNLTQEYEHAAVFYHGCLYGGVNNTEIPNYVFRWTEREVEKLIQSFAPFCKHQYLYDYGSAHPYTPHLELKNGLKVLVLSVAKPFYWLFSKVFYKQQNQFAFYVAKPSDNSQLFPWLERDKKTNLIRFNKEWAEKKYRDVKTLKIIC